MACVGCKGEQTRTRTPQTDMIISMRLVQVQVMACVNTQTQSSLLAHAGRNTSVIARRFLFLAFFWAI